MTLIILQVIKTRQYVTQYQGNYGKSTIKLYNNTKS